MPRYSARTAFAGSLLLALATPALAQDPAAFYAGKQITLGIASSPGGGYDIYARTLVRHYSRHIPGNPSIAIQYVPGGGGIVVANQMFNAARKDGTAIALLASSTFLLAALGDKNTTFKNLEFTYIGNMNEEADTCSVWHTTGIKDAKEFLSREVVIGTAGPASNSHTFPMGMNAVLGAKLKLIPGYTGASTTRTSAMEKGELQGTCGIFVSTLNSQFAKQLADGQMRVVLQMGLSRHPAYKEVPNALELAPDEKGKQALTLLFAQLALGRPFIAPPGIPADRAKALADGFAATMKDPELLADAEKLRIETRWFGPERIRELMLAMENAPEAVKSDVRRLLNMP